MKNGSTQSPIPCNADTRIRIDRTVDYQEKAREIDSFIATAMLDPEAKRTLVTLVLDLIHLTDTGTLAQGFTMGMNYAKWDIAHPEHLN